MKLPQYWNIVSYKSHNFLTSHFISWTCLVNLVLMTTRISGLTSHCAGSVCSSATLTVTTVAV